MASRSRTATAMRGAVALAVLCACGCLVAATGPPVWIVRNATDAVLGPGDYRLVGTTGSSAACEGLCEGNASCTVYSWNHQSHHCYARYDAFWDPQPNPRTMSACLAARVPGCAVPPPPTPQPSHPRMVAIPAGLFVQGRSRLPIPAALGVPVFPDGDADEQPYHPVTLSAFQLGATEVTNAQYELYDPAHRALRGRLGFSAGDDDAVVFVSHHNATGYCQWLASRSGLPYRLPTEAEWEYAARGNSSVTADSYFWTGNSVPAYMQNNQKATGIPTEGRDLRVQRFPPNGYGLYDTLGNVEEWTQDWYGPYSGAAQTDPTGPADGLTRVTRGGSHSTVPYYLRTANRASLIPEDRSWYTGFRVALAAHGHAGAAVEEDVVAGRGGPGRGSRRPDVVAARAGASGPDGIVVRRYVNIPKSGSYKLPFAIHNHEPTIVSCPDGGLFASWYSTNCGEPGRCVGLVFARLEAGAANWTEAAVQLDIADRCQCCTAMFLDDETGILYHISAVSAAGEYGDIAGILQLSRDCGQTFSRPRIIWPDHGVQHQAVVSMIKSSKGELLVPCDHWGNVPYTMLGDQSVLQHAALDRVLDPAAWHFRSPTTGNYTSTQSHHTTFTELRDGRFLAFGRYHDIDGMAPRSTSVDGGYSWTAARSVFPGIHGGQRSVMLRLGSRSTGPIVHCSFSNNVIPLKVPSSDGGSFPVLGLYCALSTDDGETFPARRCITNDNTIAGHTREGFDGKPFHMSYNTSEPDGYLAVAFSARDSTIHLISSRNHYAFSIAWLQTPAAKPHP